MVLDLFAQANNPANNQAFFAGMIIGWIFAIVLCGSIPIAVGFSKGQPVLGVIGGVCAAGGAVLLGCLLGLPIALVFVIIIFATSGNQPKRRPRRDYDEYDDDDDDRPRRRRDDDDDYDDRPRRQRDNNF